MNKLQKLTDNFTDLALLTSSIRVDLENRQSEIKSRDSVDPEIRHDYDKLNQYQLEEKIKKTVHQFNNILFECEDIIDDINQLHTHFDTERNRADIFGRMGMIFNPNTELNKF